MRRVVLQEDVARSRRDKLTLLVEFDDTHALHGKDCVLIRPVGAHVQQRQIGQRVVLSPIGLTAECANTIKYRLERLFFG